MTTFSSKQPATSRGAKPELLSPGFLVSKTLLAAVDASKGTIVTGENHLRRGLQYWRQPAELQSCKDEMSRLHNTISSFCIED